MIYYRRKSMHFYQCLQKMALIVPLEGGFPLKYWCGYLIAAIFGAFSWVLMQFGQKYQMLLDMVYPYVTKTLQSMLTHWTSSVDFLVWQTVIVIFLILVIASLIVYLISKGSLVQWFGWVLAVVSVVFFLHTAVYGLNYYADPITQNLRIEQTDYTLSQLEEAATYYRDQANEVALRLQRDEKGAAIFADFDTLAKLTGIGFKNLTLDRSFSVFGGDYTPVKKLTGMKRVDGITVPLTGESAVNPDLPPLALPFTMARETARRMCISRDEEADFSAFLGCIANDDAQFQYSGYVTAYLSCYHALKNIDPAAAEEINKGCIKELVWDINQYNQQSKGAEGGVATRLTDQANKVYENAGSQGNTTRSYGTMCDMLVSWYLQEHAKEGEVEIKFDPYDETQVDLTGLPHAKPVETEPPAETEAAE